MISIGTEGQQYFRRLIAQQGEDTVGIRIKVVHAGTPKADCQLEFCDNGDLSGDEWIVECEGFNLYVAAASAAFLDDAEIDFQSNATGGQLTIRAPKIKGVPPAGEANLVERVQHLLEAEINPGVASHGGKVSLVSVEADGVVVLRFGGGCHGCGMVDVTLRDGIERTLKARIPEITGVRDVTDHESGSAPYYKRA